MHSSKEINKKTFLNYFSKDNMMTIFDVGTYDGKEIKVYINGELVAEFKLNLEKGWIKNYKPELMEESDELADW